MKNSKYTAPVVLVALAVVLAVCATPRCAPDAITPHDLHDALLGQRASEVVQALGEPDSIVTAASGGTVWQYQLPKTAIKDKPLTSYFERGLYQRRRYEGPFLVYFDRHGVVERLSTDNAQPQ